MIPVFVPQLFPRRVSEQSARPLNLGNELTIVLAEWYNKLYPENPEVVGCSTGSVDCAFHKFIFLSNIFLCYDQTFHWILTLLSPNCANAMIPTQLPLLKSIIKSHVPKNERNERKSSSQRSALKILVWCCQKRNYHHIPSMRIQDHSPQVHPELR